MSKANEIQSDESITVKGVAVPMVIECKEGAKLDAVRAWVVANQPALEAKLKVSGFARGDQYKDELISPWLSCDDHHPLQALPLLTHHSRAVPPPHFLRFTAPYCSGTFRSQRSSILMTLSRPSM